MTKKQEFRKQTEEAKFEAFSLMCKKVADLEAKLKHAEENCINKTCVVFKDKEDCVAKLLELEQENVILKKEVQWLDMDINYDFPIADKLADLEKENERLTVSYETLKLHDEEEIGMLKSENEELKEKLKPENCLKLLAKEGYIKFTSEQLTKAKEILKAVVDFYPTMTATILLEAEQFLNSEVEK